MHHFRSIAISILLAIGASGLQAQETAEAPEPELRKPDPTRDINQIVGVVNGHPITLYEVDERIRPELAKLREEFDGLVLARQKMALRKRALRALIEDRLLLEEARETIPEGRKKQIDLSVDAAVEGLIREAGSLVLFQQKLKEKGKTVEDVRRKRREEEIIREFISDRINRRIVVTPRDVQRYYEEHKDEFSHERKVHARVILVPFAEFQGDKKATLEKAREVVEKIRKGSDFAEMAKRFPGSPRSDEGGDFGFIKSPYFNKAVDEVLFGLEPHTVPEPIETRLGYFVVRVDAEKPARVEPIEDVQDDIMKTLIQRQRKDLLKEFTQELYKDAVVRTVW